METHVLVPDRILTIEGFFSPDECHNFIAHSEGNGFSAAPVATRSGEVMMPDMRNNDRVVRDSPDLASELWPRIAPFVFSPLWSRRAIGLNERWRFYRYDPGQRFAPHMDGTLKRDNGERSQVTFMIYLNEEFEGGHTRFNLRSPHGEINVAPKVGMALLFVHNVLHEGAPVTSGRKYVLRTDVMYGAPQEATL